MKKNSSKKGRCLILLHRLRSLLQKPSISSPTALWECSENNFDTKFGSIEGFLSVCVPANKDQLRHQVELKEIKFIIPESHSWFPPAGFSNGQGARAGSSPQRGLQICQPPSNQRRHERTEEGGKKQRAPPPH